jgi:hypothetical protein
MKLYPNIYRTPFGEAPLVFFTGEKFADLVGGQYVWDSTLVNFQPDTDLQLQALYFFWDFDFTVDISEQDFQGGIGTNATPKITIYQSSKPNESLFRQPFLCPKYYEHKPILQGRLSPTLPNKLQFGVTGTVNQTPSLIGKTSIKAIIQITAHAITDPDYKKAFQDGILVPNPVMPGPKTQLSADQLKLGKQAAQFPNLRSEEGLSLPL